MRRPTLRLRGARFALLAQVLGGLAVTGLTVFAILRARSPQGLLLYVPDDQVGVLADYGSDSVHTVSSPGMYLVLPELQELYALRRSPLEYVMEGNERASDLQVPRLIVRASDGSSFWFDRVTIQYALDPSRAALALSDTGPGEELRAALMDAHARSILRDEFGRYSPTEIVLPENRRTAAERSQERLGAALAPHGIAVLEVALTKPAFDQRYEQTIERRKIAEQEIARLERESELLLAGREDLARNLRAKQQLVLAKSHSTWEAALEALAREAQGLHAGRAERLERVRSEHELALEKARRAWDSALAAAVDEGTRLEAGREDRLAAVRRAHTLKLEAEQSEWSRREVALEREAASLRAQGEGRLALARTRQELELGEARDAWASSLATAERETRQQLAEARGAAQARVAAAELERNRALAKAADQKKTYRSENERFTALARALERGGPALVRAALVDVLRGVPIEIAPHERTEPATSVALRTAPAREEQ